MSAKSRVASLGELNDGQEADFFVVCTQKDEHKTRDGKPYFRVGFRDATREVVFPVWADAPFAAACRDQWTVGRFYKFRAQYKDGPYGPRLEIRQFRDVTEADRADGFDPESFLPRSLEDPAKIFAELVEIAQTALGDESLSQFVVRILHRHEIDLLRMPAHPKTHQAYVGGLLEHSRNTALLCQDILARLPTWVPLGAPRVDASLVIAGAILHDIGKVRELTWQGHAVLVTADGWLLGHLVLGRDILREMAGECPIATEQLRQLEHIVVSHHETPEQGAVKPPMTVEALIVRQADDLDAKLHMYWNALLEESTGLVTSARNPLLRPLYKNDPREERPGTRL